MKRLKKLVWVGSFLGALASFLVLLAINPNLLLVGGILITLGYGLSALWFVGGISTYRRQEINYYRDRGWLHFSVGLFGPFIVLANWLTDR